jgi:hypothetical protein
MSTTICLMFFLLIFGCSTSNDSNDSLELGQARITIENNVYNANALMNHQILAETEFEKISLIINDTVKIEILKEDFIEETIYWTIENHVSPDIIFSLQYNYYGGSLYLPLEGFLKIDQKTMSSISGEFQIILTGSVYSCITCPEALKNVKGKFIVKI